MLIIALGVLTLLAILGAAFASLIRLEKKATDNYIDARRMGLLLDSAVDRVIADLFGAKNWRSYSVWKDSPWLYMLKNEGDLAHGRVDMTDDRVGRWEIFAEHPGQTYSYKTKVIDCSAQINLNGRQDTLARMLDNLADAIERSERLKRDGKKIRNPLFAKPNASGNKIKGQDIVNLRRRLPGGLFTSKTQIKQLIGAENYAILEDFITVSSWEDPYTFKPTDGLDEVPNLLLPGGNTGGRGVGGGNSNLAQDPASFPSARLGEEPRHPINVNTAPEEVLVACLQGLAGRRIFPYSKLGAGGGSMVPVDQGATITGERNINLREEVRDITPRAVFVYSPRLEYNHAKTIADRIMARRKQQPFMTWRTNQPQNPGFEDFIDQLETNAFPAPQQCIVIDPAAPQNQVAEQQIIKQGPATPIGLMWSRGHGTGAIRQLRSQFAMSVHDQNAWYYELIKGVLKANFNPNTRINRYNPNAPAYVEVDKSDLVWCKTRDQLHKGYTTEFCFDTNGIYEITALGRVAARSSEKSTSVDGKAPVDPLDGMPFERRMRTVVKVFELLRHTNQLHFEKTFVSGTRSSKADRKYVVTYPDPMAGLTELFSGGSIRDGRVELAGLLDGNRLEMPLQVRQQSYKTNPSIVAAHGFMDRSAQSLQKLRQYSSGGSGGLIGESVFEALREALDFNYSKIRGTDARRLRRAELTSGGIYKNADAIPLEPDVKKEVDGTDLFPDGLHSSLLRATHLGAKVLLLPARARIGGTTYGGGNSMIGASGLGSRGQNLLGNVPYYKGGIGFWVKFDFNGDDPVFSGLVAATQVIKEVVPAASDYTGSEGSQFFIFRNSEGRLRIVRLYYHQAFPDVGGADGGGDEGGEPILYPRVDVTNQGGGGGGGGESGQNPIVQELDQKKVVARADIVVDARHFRAHEWHHIAVDWDDDDYYNPIRLYIDFTEARDAGAARKPQDPSTLSTPSSWVRLNERQPKDGLFVGGIIREQGVAEYGLFKWFTNSTDAARSGGGQSGFIQTIAQSVKKVLANATIDELVCFEGRFPTVKTYYGGAGSPGYFTNQVAEYANVFEIPLPPDVDHVTLRSFDWTSYHPTMYTDSRINAQPQKLNKLPLRCDLGGTNFIGESAPQEFQEPWTQPGVINQVAGRRVYRRAGDISKGNKAELVYKFKFQGAKSQTGNTGGGVVQTPAIDDVTLTYFLPNPKILLQEEVD